MKVAIVHYWFVTWRGGEKVVEAILEKYPEADIYTHVYCPVGTEGKLSMFNITETFISKLPKAIKKYQKYLPFMPMALEQLDLREYDLVISSESGPAKGIITRPDALHICYCHSPMRYVWDMYPDYLKEVGRFTRFLMRPLIHYLKMWDRLSADRVDYFIANSVFVASRIRKFYRRESVVINPPVDISEFLLRQEKEEFFLVLGQLTPYKRADLVVEAFKKTGKHLIVIGDGEQYEQLKRQESKNISILGRAEWGVCKDHLSRAKALIFPGVEDFGMVPVEAMACGTPVIAYGKGGALETVVDESTGLIFNEQSVEAINQAIEKFESMEWNPHLIRDHSEQFGKERFLREISEFIEMRIEGN